MVYFNESRLNFSDAEDFAVKTITFSVYGVLASAAVFSLFSDIFALKSFGFLLVLFLSDRIVHLNKAERDLRELKGAKINAALFLTPSAFRLLNFSLRKALWTKENFSLLLFKELTKRTETKKILRRLDIPYGKFLGKIETELKEKKNQGANRGETLILIETLSIAAYEKALAAGEKFVEPRNFLAALADAKSPEILKIFEFFNIDAADLEEAVIFGRFSGVFSKVRKLPQALGGAAYGRRFLKHGIMNRAWTARPTPTLDQFGTDLTELARAEKIGFLIGHEKEFESLLNVVSRPGKPNALLVGEPGAGKSTLIAHLAFRMEKDRVPPVLFDKRLVSLEIGELVADAPPEILAGRLRKITEEIILAGNIVLFIPNIHDLFRTGENKTLNAIDVLLPVVRNEAIPVIGESYPREFKRFIESRSDFLEQFEVVKVEEMSEREAERFLIYASLVLEKEFKVFITFRAIRRAVELTHRYFRNKILPGGAVDLLKQALAVAQKTKEKVLTEDIVIEIAEKQSNVPIQKAGAAETEKLLNLEKLIHERLINQNAAVGAVSRALREYRSGLSRKGGPIAAFLFVGPTGVGKTELSKILAKIQFGSAESMMRFDMSEYQDKQSIFRFIGTPDGEKTGALTDAILEKPYSLVLLDEFEKAHPDILNLFLQVFDDGRLTDSLGRTVDFQNTIVITTSNAHSEFIKAEIESGKKIEEVGEELKKRLTSIFKPELLNRFSDTIVFRNLNKEEILAVAKILVKEVIDVLKETHGVDLIIADSALREIADLGYSPVFGARPLRQVISEKIKSVLAEKILRKEIARGNKLECVFEGNDFRFSIRE